VAPIIPEGRCYHRTMPPTTSDGSLLSGTQRPVDLPRRPLAATLSGLARLAADALGADGAALYLIDAAEGDLVLTAGHNLPEAAMGHRLALGDGLTGRVAAQARSVLSQDAALDPRSLRRRADWEREPVVRGYLGAPLRAGGSILGVIELTSHRAGAFGPEERGRASILADAAALLVERTRLLEQPPPAALASGGDDGGHDPIGIATVNARLLLTSATPTFCRLVGQPVEAIVGRPAMSILPALGRPGARDALEAALHGAPGHVGRIGLPPSRTGGEAVKASLSIIPVGDAARGVDGVLLALHDVSARARLEAELREQTDRAVEARDRLRSVIEVVSHELRTPLTSVLGFARLLHDRPEAEPERRGRWAEQVIDKARLMARLVDEVTDLARLGSVGFSLQRGPLAMGPLAREIVAEIEAAATRQTQIDLLIAPDLPLVHADRDRLSQVLHNLLANALRHGRHPVLLRLRAEPEAVILEVSDHGPGVPPEQAEAIFEPFVRLTSGTGAVPGTGLGLPVCRGIVEAHGGTIRCLAGPEGGALFQVSLPLEA